MRKLGSRIRARIKATGFGNINELLKALGISSTLVHDLEKGRSRDVGLRKVASLAVMLGMRPSDLVRELDDLLLNPEPLPNEMAQTLRIPPRSGGHDIARLAMLADVVLGWDEETEAAQRPEEVGALIGALYDDLVAPDPTISMLDLRRRAAARLYGVSLPTMSPGPRGRGRPHSSAAA